MSKRAVLYARGRRGLANQLGKYRAHAQQRGWQIVAELTEDDRDTSGTVLPQLHRALEMARAGEFDVLVTESADRLCRDRAGQRSIEHELEQAGVEIAYTRDAETPPYMY